MFVKAVDYNNARLELHGCGWYNCQYCGREYHTCQSFIYCRGCGANLWDSQEAHIAKWMAARQIAS